MHYSDGKSQNFLTRLLGAKQSYSGVLYKIWLAMHQRNRGVIKNHNMYSQISLTSYSQISKNPVPMINTQKKNLNKTV